MQGHRASADYLMPPSSPHIAQPHSQLTRSCITGLRITNYKPMRFCIAYVLRQCNSKSTTIGEIQAVSQQVRICASNTNRRPSSGVWPQLYQGVFKSWDHFYLRCEMSAPQNHNIQPFMKDYLGRPHRQTKSIIKYVASSGYYIRLPDSLSNTRLLRSVHGILDFLYFAQWLDRKEKILRFQYVDWILPALDMHRELLISKFLSHSTD